MGQFYYYLPLYIILIFSAGVYSPQSSPSHFKCSKILKKIFHQKDQYAHKRTRQKVYKIFKENGLNELPPQDKEWMEDNIKYIKDIYQREIIHTKNLEKIIKENPSDHFIAKEIIFLKRRFESTPFGHYNDLLSNINHFVGIKSLFTDNTGNLETRVWLVDIIENSILRTKGGKSFPTPTTVKKVRNKNPINSKYAGSFYPPDLLPFKLRMKYKNIIVYFDDEGFPLFSAYAKKTVKIKAMGNNSHDFAAADKAAGFTSENPPPPDHTWHHHQDGESMLLLPTDIHHAIKHTGGVSRKIDEFTKSYK